jgi:hypothetical protein
MPGGGGFIGCTLSSPSGYKELKKTLYNMNGYVVTIIQFEIDTQLYIMYKGNGKSITTTNQMKKSQIISWLNSK